MKKIINWVMLAAVFGASGVLMGQEEDASAAPQGEETAEAKVSPADQIKALNEKFDGVLKAYEALKAPRPTLKSRVDRSKEEVAKRVKSMEDYIRKIAETDAAIQAKYATEYVFETVPREERTKYADEGSALMKKAITLMSSKGKEADLIEGIEAFEILRESYHGIPRFKEASMLFVKTLNRLERKWRNARERVERDRQKMSDSNRAKVLDLEESLFQRLEQKLQESGKSVDRNWFAPGGRYSTNLKALDRLIQRAKSSAQSSQNKPVEHAEEVPALLERYWAAVDEAVSKMCSGAPEEASKILDNNEDYRTITSLYRNCMPEALKAALRDQHQKLKSEINTRTREVSSLKREKDRAVMNLEREMRSQERTIERLQEDVASAKEDEDRREAEEAERKAEEEARKAEEEAERQAEEEARKAEEAEEDDDDEEEAEKPKKSTKSKKG